MMRLGSSVGTNLPVEEDVKTSVREAASSKVRAVKVVVDSKRPRLVLRETIREHDNFEEDFEAICEFLEDAVPCIFLVRLKDAKGTVASAGDGDWALLAWTPEDAPVRQKMTYASSRRCLKDAFKDLSFLEFAATERGDVTLAEFLAQTKPLTEEERHAAMTQAEIDAEQARRQQAAEQAAAPKMLAGLAAVQIRVLDTFSECLARVLTEDGKAVMGRLAGDRGEDLAGELLEAAPAPEALKGRLPSSEPCYVVLPSGAAALLFLSWLPEGASAKSRMKCSTFKASALEAVRHAAGERRVVQVEVSDEADLTADLGAASVGSSTGAERGTAAATSGAAGGGPKRPPGGVALPGLGAAR